MEICVSGLSERVLVRSTWILRRIWHVVVDGNVDALDIDATAEDIGADADTVNEVLEVGVALDTVLYVSMGIEEVEHWETLPLLLTDTRVHSHRWEVTLAQETIEFRSTHSALDENNDLIVIELIENVVKTTILLSFPELDIVLLETVKRKLSFVVNVDLKWILHELLADRACGWGERGREHHDLFLSGSGAEDFLDVTAHVYLQLESVFGRFR